MKTNFFILTILCCLSLHSFGQATIFFDDADANAGIWTITDSNFPNSWINSTCAGNGPSNPGSNTYYITYGGVTPGCAPGDKGYYAYDNASTGSLTTTFYSAVDATCASSLNLSYDYMIDGVVGEDFAQVTYSLDNGLTWIPIGTDLVASSGWATNSIALPAVLDNASFLLAFRFTFSDANIVGNPLAFDNVLITGTDNTPPTITCNATTLLASNAACEAIAINFGNEVLSLSDNCTDSAFISISQSIMPGTNLMATPGTDVPLTITATDESGNSSNCVLTIQVRDTTAPAMTCGPGTAIYLNSNCDGVVPDLIAQTSATDNCTASGSIVYSQNPVAGSIVNGQGTVLITVSAMDTEGNTNQCLYNTLKLDTLPATIICPGNQIVYANGSCAGNLGDYRSLAIVNDNCVASGSLTITQNPAPGTIITDTIIVQLTVSGGSPTGSITCDFSAFLVDTISPSVLCPLPTTLYTNSNCEAVLPNYAASAGGSDNCSATLTFTQNPLPGTMVLDGQIVTITGTDESGNSDVCTLIQNVQDTVSPIIDCTLSLNYFVDNTCQFSIQDISSLLLFSDNCTANPSLTYSQNPAPGTLVSANGNILVTVTDVQGNSSNCSVPYVLNDTISPTFTCPLNSLAITDANCSFTIPDYSSSISINDNCTSSGFFTYSQNPIPGTVVNGLTTQNITLSVSDESGNSSSSCVFSLMLTDTMKPTISCPGSYSQIADVNCESIAENYLSLPSGTDNCSGSITFTQSPPAGSPIVDNELITLTGTDVSGNSNSCVMSIQLIDTIKPQVICSPTTADAIVSNNCDYAVPDFIPSITGSGSDNCTAVNDLVYTQSPLPGAISSGVTIVTMTVFDEQANSNTCTFTINPIDTISPTITCPGDQTLNIGSLCSANVPNFIPMATALDNCNALNIFQNPVAGTSLSNGTHTILLTTTDQGSNSATCSFTLEIIENESPVITCPADISSCNPIVSFSDATATDNCAFTVSRNDMLTFQSGDNFPVGNTTLSYIAIDSSGNSSTCSFDITIFELPSQATIISSDTSLCETFNTAVSGVVPTNGVSNWTVLSGTGSIINPAANATQINGLSYGLNEFVYNVTSASCGSTSDTISISVFQTPSQASINLDSIYACSSNTVFILASTPIIGMGTWTSLENNAIQSINAPNTTTTVSQEAFNTYYWTVSNGNCAVSRDSIKVFKSITPQFNINDTTICSDQLPLLIAVVNINVPSENGWSVLEGNITLEDYLSYSTFTGSDGAGTNVLEFESQQYNCIAVRNTVTITIEECEGFDPIIGNMITPNGDGINDLFDIPNLNQSYPDCEVRIFNRWGSVVYESVGYIDPWNGKFKGENLPMGTYFYNILLNDEADTLIKGSINLIR